MKELSVLLDVGLVQELFRSSGVRMNYSTWEVLLEMARRQRKAGPGRWFYFKAMAFLKENGLNVNSYKRARTALLKAGVIASMPGSKRIVMRPNVLWIQSAKRSAWLELLMQAFDKTALERAAAIAKLKPRYELLCEDPIVLPERKTVKLGPAPRRWRR